VSAAEAAGGKVADVVKRAQKAFGPDCRRFSLKLIIPALIARGLLDEKKVLFVRAFRLTPEGKEAQSRIKSDLAKADEIARLLRSDPARAAAMAKTLGVNVLLSDKLTKEFKPLADAMRVMTHAEFGDVGPFDSGGGFDFGSFDLSHFDLGSFDAGAIDALHASINSFDAGFSDAGAHGGHDGGGGHH